MLSSFANSLVTGKLSDRFHGQIPGGVEPCAVTQDAPRRAGQLVGQGNRSLVPGHSRYGAFEPGSEAERLPSVGAHHDHFGRLHEEHAQVSASPLGDPPEDRAPSRAELSGHQPDPGGEVAAPADRRDHGRRNHRSDAGDRHDVRAVLFRAADLLDLGRYGGNPVIDPEPVAVEPDQDAPHAGRDLVASLFEDRLEGIPQGA